MAGSRDAVRMDEAEVAAFLGTQLKVQVASLGPDGHPHLTTLFYVLDEGRIAFWTYGRSQKIRNLERDDRVSCLVEDGTEYAELRGVSIRGRAEIVRDRAEIERIGGAVVVAMTGVGSLGDLGELGRTEVERQAAKRVAVVVRPDHVASWDHRKLATRG
ncbi:PPOX class F420-dependent oxidoreductase [Nocardioides aestuarii]|uniref:Pyridoxamine 5'-phosphate oxidase family protein n=1 Tax=Nocardioides aestuarii TaxID=252231 RepID=A0ABW4TQZ7_9ACTN